MNIFADPAWWAVVIAALAFAASGAGVWYARSAAAAARDSAAEAKRANDLTERELNKYEAPWEIITKHESELTIRNSSNEPAYLVMASALDLDGKATRKAVRGTIQPWASFRIKRAAFTRATDGGSVTRLGRVLVTWRVGSGDSPDVQRWEA